jgi:hypothetical protein
LNINKISEAVSKNIFIWDSFIYLSQNHRMKIKPFTLLFFSGILVFIFASCSSHLTKQTGKKEAIIYPSPPDTARIQFLTSFSSSERVSKKQSGFSKFISGESPAKPIKKPYGIALRNGKLYICDLGLSGLEIIDLDKNTFSYFIPKGKGFLKTPINCFVDENDQLYVADGERKQVVLFNADGECTGSFGDADKFKPTDVFVYDNKVWVANLKNNRINVYGKEPHHLLYSFPDSALGHQGYLFSPTNIFVTERYVYVSDMGDFKIKVYDHSGKFIRSVGSAGDKPGQLARPKGIAVDREENLYIVDAGIENTQIFNRDGNVLMYFGGPYNGPGDMWLPAKIIIDYDNLKYFRKYVDSDYELKYLILVTNQYGPDKVNIYGRVEPRKTSQK